MVEQLPKDVIARLRALDSAITPELAEASWALLTPFHEKLGYAAPRIVRDLRYGEHPRHRLDVHSGCESAGDGSDDHGTDDHGAPVFVFVHGGGFVRGDKHQPGTPAYDMVGAWAVRHGWVGVNMTYRYAPEVQWPAGAEDVAAAVAWIRSHIAAYGGDPDRIIVAGNSAGATHAADFGAGHGGDLTGVRGVALISGIYTARTSARAAAPGAPPHPYYGDAVSDPMTASLPCLVESHVPVLFAVAERDPERFHSAVAEAVAAWTVRHGTVPDLVWIDGHNHMSAVGSLGVDEAALGVPLARFVERHTTAG
jgi:triacylglycerol lipase